MSTLVGVVLIGLLIYVVIRVGAQSKPPSRGQVLARPPRVTVSVDTGSGGEVQFPSTTRHRVEPAKLARAADQRWIPPESNVTVANRRISGGMVYVGSSLLPVGGWQDSEPALIVPGLKIARGRCDYSGEGMGYWPSYSEIPDESRAAYLDWLAGGRSDADAYIGYVFLFFYGLERRLLFDLRYLPERRGEARALIGEIERLRSIYAGNRSFDGYSTSLVRRDPVSVQRRISPSDGVDRVLGQRWTPSFGQVFVTAKVESGS